MRIGRIACPSDAHPIPLYRRPHAPQASTKHSGVTPFGAVSCRSRVSRPRGILRRRDGRDQHQTQHEAAWCSIARVGAGMALSKSISARVPHPVPAADRPSAMLVSLSLLERGGTPSPVRDGPRDGERRGACTPGICVEQAEYCDVNPERPTVSGPSPGERCASQPGSSSSQWWSEPVAPAGPASCSRSHPPRETAPSDPRACRRSSDTQHSPALTRRRSRRRQR